MSEREQFREVFREEAAELLSKMEEVILLLEKDSQNTELINNLFRIMHTIKGSGAMFGFQKMADFAHRLETALDALRNGVFSITSEFINFFLSAKDQIQKMVNTPDGETGIDLEELNRILTGVENLSKPKSSPSGKESFSQTQLISSDKIAYRLRIKLHPSVIANGMDPLCLLKELRSLGELSVHALTDDIPLLEKMNPEQCYLNWDAVINTTAGLEDLKNVFLFVQDESQVSITPLISELSGKEKSKKIGEILVERGDVKQKQLENILSKQKRIGELIVEKGLVSQSKIESALTEQKVVRELQSGQKQINTIRVSTEKLDQLINLVGEMVISQAQLSQTSSRYKDQDLLTPVENVARLTNELRDCALNIRMLPIETTFGKFRRLVRDLSGSLGKDIELVTEGGQTELDKTVIERIQDPLVHLIRNSLDHGLEAPEERRKAGKAVKGTIRLTAGQSGGEVIICIEDDGAGLDKDKIRARGIERNLIKESDVLTDSQIFNLIFQPGFSTAERITDVSGRGVGMDVVKREISKLRGSVGIESKRGEGTKISIQLPLTLAIIEGLLISVDSMPYVVPLTFVRECVELTERDVTRSHGRHILQVRGDTIPYIRLREVFVNQGQRPSIEYAVIVTIEGRRIGLVTDDIIGNHQAVIKSLGKVYEHVEGVSGATILGNGNIALILDVRQLSECAQQLEREMLVC